MSQFWSFYIAIIVVLNIAGCLWLLWWTAKRPKGGEQAQAETTGHVWDGDLTELNKPLPRWWINLFYLTIVFAIGYMVVFPGFGGFKGTSGWTAAKEHDAAKAKGEKTLSAQLGQYAGKPIDVIAKDPNAVNMGGRIFSNNCAMCHGSDAHGGKGFPNLTDEEWQWGGTPADILTTITEGRIAAMPPLADALGGENGVREVASYVQSLSGMQVDTTQALAGKNYFDRICAACHGPAGKGNPAMGALNLTDNTWRYGSDIETIKNAIRLGHNGQMPAHKTLLAETQIRLVGAYVWSLSKHPVASK